MAIKERADSLPGLGGMQARAADLGGPGAVITTARYVARDKRGFPIYAITVRDRRGKIVTSTWAWTGSSFAGAQPLDTSRGTGVPQAPRQVDRPGGVTISGAPTSDSRLSSVQDKWLSWIANNTGVRLEPTEAQSLRDMVVDWSASASNLDRAMAQAVSGAPFLQEGTGSLPPPEFDLGIPGGGGFGGGGGGFAGPVYERPDERVVEDMVKGMLVSLTGTVPEKLVGGLVSVFMTDHRRNFDNPNQEIDPSQSVLEGIRETEEYQSIHALRPDSEDERSWISQRRAAAAQGGLQTDLQEDFAITQATVGGDVQDVVRAGAVKQTQVSGSTSGTVLENTVKNVSRAIFQGVGV